LNQGDPLRVYRLAASLHRMLFPDRWRELGDALTAVRKIIDGAMPFTMLRRDHDAPRELFAVFDRACAASPLARPPLDELVSAIDQHASPSDAFIEGLLRTTFPKRSEEDARIWEDLAMLGVNELRPVKYTKLAATTSIERTIEEIEQHESQIT